MKVLIKNLRYIVIAVGVVLVWRGIWGLADKFLLPEHELISFLLSIGTGVFILLLVDYENKDIRELF